MNLVELRGMELTQQKQGLLEEFARWREKTAPGRRLEKHHTQVDRVTRQLEALLDELGEPAGQDADLRVYSRALLMAHLIWAYYGSKLAQREVDWFGSYLVCADEFAWECYRPARDAAQAAGIIPIGELKEPPLVFLGDQPSMFVLTRDRPLRIQGITEQDLHILGEALLRLPIPVIGVPWYYSHHLPSAVTIGHSVGHIVVEDFDLPGVIRERLGAMDGIPVERREAWRIWGHEVFADCYGTLCGGPAFVMALMGLLADYATAFRHEKQTARNWRPHPPGFLRILYCCHVLSALGFGDEAQELEGAWRGTFGPHAMAEFEPDIPHVVQAMLEDPLPAFGSVPVQAVVSFNQLDLASAHNTADRIGAGLLVPAGQSFRQLMAAATIASHADPAGYDAQNREQPVLERMLVAMPPGVRSVKEEISKAEIDARDEADAQAGQSFADLFVPARAQRGTPGARLRRTPAGR